MTDKPVVVYGATGYTGRLICEYLREYNLPFVAAGRDGKRVAEVLDRVPGIETADYEVAEVEGTVDALTDLFLGAKVVCNTVGPFISYGDTTVEAALNAGCHYLDTTGEQDWTMHVADQWGSRFADAGLVVAPGVAQFYTTGEIAANICLETPGLDSLDILNLFNGLPTYASTQTIFTILKADWFYLEENQYKQWDPLTTFSVTIPGQHELGLALPWGGTCHPVWFKNDPRVANVKAASGVFDKTVMQGVVETTKMFEEKIKPLPLDQQEAALAEIAGSVQGGMPPRENPRGNTMIDSVWASGPLGRAHCVIYGNQNYKQTGLLQAYGAVHLSQAPPLRTGFASACQAFGYRQLLGVLQNFGFLLEPIVDVYR
jgi:hypothetical protein